MQPGDNFTALSVPRVVAYDTRTTPKTPVSTTELEVFRFDNVPLINGHLYEVTVSNINADGDTAGQIALVRLRIATAGVPGTLATTSSTQKNSWRQYIDDATNSNVVPWVNYYEPTGDGFGSFLWTMQKQGSAGGNIQWFTSATDVAEFVIKDLGDVSGVPGGTNI